MDQVVLRGGRKDHAALDGDPVTGDRPDRAREALEALVESWRYKGEFGWGSWQEGYGPDPEGQVLDECASRLRALLADDSLWTGTPEPPSGLTCKCGSGWALERYGDRVGCPVHGVPLGAASRGTPLVADKEQVKGVLCTQLDRFKPMHSCYDGTKALFDAGVVTSLPDALGKLAEDKAVLIRVRHAVNVSPKASKQWLRALRDALAAADHNQEATESESR